MFSPNAATVWYDFGWNTERASLLYPWSIDLVGDNNDNAGRDRSFLHRVMECEEIAAATRQQDPYSSPVLDLHDAVSAECDATS